MRGVRTAGVGVGILIASHVAAGQEARPGRLRLAAAPTGRGQMPNPPAAPPSTLGTPRPLGSPTVTAEPAAPPGSAPAPVQPPVYTAPPVTYPMGVTPGYPLPSYQTPVPGYPTAGFPAVEGAAPVPAPATAGGPLFAPPPRLEAPLYGGVAGPVTAGAPLLAGPSRWDLSAEMLLWWVQAPRLPVLVTTSSPAFNGILGQGNTRAVYGGDTLSTSVHAGGRFGAAYWLNPEHTWAVDGNVFFLGRGGKEFRTNTSENALLARPFVSANTAQPFSQLVAGPGLATGGVAVRPSTQVWGAELNLRRPLLVCDPCRKLDLFAGFRYFNLNDELLITETFARTPGSPASIGTPTALFGTVTDRFRTENDFYGAQVGLLGEVRRGRWFAGYKASVALGTVFQSVDIDGGQAIQTTSGLTTAAGGLLALPGANIGRFSQREFGVLPEAGLKVGWYATERLKLGIGYNFLYLNSVLRAGDQIDPILDVNRIPNFPLPPAQTGPAAGIRPAVPFRTTDAFVQGVSLSLEYTW